jgi:precorrin-2 methylase
VKLYFNEATSSVYFMNPTEGSPAGFNGCYLVKKELDQENGVTDAIWDGTHIVTVAYNGDMATYSVFSTVQMTIDTKADKIGDLTIAGACSHNDKKEGLKMPAEGPARDAFHIRTLGTMIEMNEKELRTQFDNVYVNKQREITNNCRKLDQMFQDKDSKARFN